MYKEEEFLETIVKAIVVKKDEVKITRKVDELGVLLILSVSQEDLPRIIGKEGQTAKALRTLLRVLGYSQKIKASLQINTPNSLNRVNGNKK